MCSHQLQLTNPLTFPEAHTAIIPRGGQQGASYIPAHTPHLGVMVVKLSHNLHLKLGGSCRGSLLPVRWIQNIEDQFLLCSILISVIFDAGFQHYSLCTSTSYDNVEKSPHGNKLENSDIFCCNGEDMERSSQVWCKCNIMDCISDSHQRLCFGIFPF